MMSVKVKLSDLLFNLELAPPHTPLFLDKQTGRVEAITDEEMRAIEDDEPLDGFPEWQQEAIRIAKAIDADDGTRYLPLPDEFDFYTERKHRGDAAARRMVIEWCEENEIECEDD